MNERNKIKRVEYRGKNVRVSRTEGVSVRAQQKLGDVNITENSNHGVRVSTKVAKGTNVFVQNGRIGVKGRYAVGRGGHVNVSKTGVSYSEQTKLGTYNWTHPNRSSVTIGGVQLRGRKAANIQAIYFLFQAVAWVFKVIFKGVTGLIGLFQRKKP